MVSNAEVASRLTEIADLLDLLGERFKPEAYRRAARSVEALPESLETIASRGELRTIPGFGEAISDKVAEILRTGSLGYLDRLRAQVPNGVLELMRLAGVGPKTARRFWVELGVEGPAELSGAIAAGRLTGVRGFGEKKIAQLRAAVGGEGGATGSRRVPIESVWPVARSLVGSLRNQGSVHEVSVAGSFRRGRETVGDLDILVTSDAPESVFEAFSRLAEVREVRLRGPTKETVVLHGGLQVDLRVVAPESFGAALQYFTGSKDHNVRLRSLARERGLKVNEYGVYRGDDRIGGRSEEEVYRALGLAYIPPELREDRGEIAAATAGPLPRLVEPADLRTELHVHLSASPDATELARLVASARERSIGTVGVVVGTWEEGSHPESVPPRRIESLRSASVPDVRLAPVLEIAGEPSEDQAGKLAKLGADWLVVVPRVGSSGLAGALRAGPPAKLVAHVGGPAESAGPVLELARELHAAVEVGPGPQRFDSSVGLTAREAGVRLGLPTGVGAPPDDPTSAVALGFARRAGATKDDVLNARAPGPPGGRAQGGAGPTARRGRPGPRRP